jgi:hypothetical protein
MIQDRYRAKERPFLKKEIDEIKRSAMAFKRSNVVSIIMHGPGCDDAKTLVTLCAVVG